MSETNGKFEQPKAPAQWCERHEKMIRDIHLAVCGDDKLGVPGLVSDVKDLKEFRRTIELRVATVSGGITVLVLAAKAIWEKIKT